MRLLRAISVVVLVAHAAQAEPQRTGQAQAKAHLKQGLAFFAAGDYAHAIAEYEAAYQLAPLPEVLFNLGQAHRARGDGEKAIEYYKKYLAVAEKGEARSEAERRIAELNNASRRRAQAAEAEKQERVAAERTAAERAVTQKAVEERRAADEAERQRSGADLVKSELRSARAQKAAGLAVLAVGVASLVLGATFVGLASQANDQFLHPANGTYSSDAEAHRRTYQTLDVVFFSLGGVATATGLALFLLGRHEAQTWSLRAAASPAGARASLELRF